MEQQTAKDLLALTGKESGIILYDQNEVIACNWASIDGMPRIFADSIIGLGEELTGKYLGQETFNYNNNDWLCEKWEVNGVIVYCPLDWH